MISIKVQDLVKKFGETVALDHLNLAIDPGEIFFLLGPSGCGKTTLLRTIAGFYTPEQGRIFFGEENVTKLPPHRRHTGMMFQSYALWPHMTVEKNVAFGLEERKVPRAEISERVGEALAAVRMAPYASRKISQLSGGQQQRVALARAMVIRPRCLLLDEPLSNLDAKLRLEMRGEIRTACKSHGLTAIYVTHDQKEALSIADRLAVLDAGVIRQLGTPAEVYRQPNSRFVAEFIGESNFLEGTVLSSANGFTLVDTPAGQFEGLTNGTRFSEGERVTVSIRPEAWTLQRAARPGNSVAGRVVETIYLGEMAQHQFVAEGCALKIFELNPRPARFASAPECMATTEAGDVAILRE